jgi:hypothetical protein
VNQRLITCFQNDTILPLRLKPGGFLHLRQFVSVRSGRVIVEDSVYRYSLSENPDDEDRWIFRYDYSLNPEENVPHAHLHVNAEKGDEPLRHIHFPTGRLSIEQIIAHLICEHGIESKRTDWLDFLTNSHRGFLSRRTDPPLFP